jgi:hypothetical protein
MWVQSTAQGSVSRIGCVAEIVQFVGSIAQQKGLADFVLVSRTIVGEPHDVYKMRCLQKIPNEYLCVQTKVGLFKLQVREQLTMLIRTSNAQ